MRPEMKTQKKYEPPEEMKHSSKGSTTWIPDAILNIVKEMQVLRGDEHMSTTAKFLMLKGLSDLGFLSPDKMKALGMIETGIDRIHIEQVVPLTDRLTALWNKKCLEYTESVKVLEFNQTSKQQQLAFLNWVKERNLL